MAPVTDQTPGASRSTRGRPRTLQIRLFQEPWKIRAYGRAAATWSVQWRTPDGKRRTRCLGSKKAALEFSQLLLSVLS